MPTLFMLIRGYWPRFVQYRAAICRAGEALAATAPGDKPGAYRAAASTSAADPYQSAKATVSGIQFGQDDG